MPLNHPVFCSKLTFRVDSHLVLIVFELGDHHALRALVPDDGDAAPHPLAELHVPPHCPELAGEDEVLRLRRLAHLFEVDHALVHTADQDPLGGVPVHEVSSPIVSSPDMS